MHSFQRGKNFFAVAVERLADEPFVRVLLHRNAVGVRTGKALQSLPVQDRLVELLFENGDIGHGWNLPRFR